MADFSTRLDEAIGPRKHGDRKVANTAHAAGVDKARVHEWLKGSGNPQSVNLAALADYFGVSMDWLWGRTEVREVARPATSPSEGEAGDAHEERKTATRRATAAADADTRGRTRKDRRAGDGSA